MSANADSEDVQSQSRCLAVLSSRDREQNCVLQKISRSMSPPWKCIFTQNSFMWTQDDSTQWHICII